MTKKRDGRGRMRDYDKEYKRDHKPKKDREDRAKRNSAAKKKKCPPGKEVDHKKPLSKGGSNKRSNLRCVTRKTNSARSNRARGKKK